MRRSAPTFPPQATKQDSIRYIVANAWRYVDYSGYCSEEVEKLERVILAYRMAADKYKDQIRIEEEISKVERKRGDEFKADAEQLDKENQELKKNRAVWRLAAYVLGGAVIAQSLLN